MGVTTTGDAAGSATIEPCAPAGSFCHQALFTRGADECIAALARFVRQGVGAGDAVVVVLGAPKLARLRDAVTDVADRVVFEDMAEVGGNPALLLARLQAFVDELPPGRRARVAGEPVTADRSREETDECLIHEGLVNVAFAAGTPLWLVCAYDADTLDGATLDGARRTHPYVVTGGLQCRPSGSYAGAEAWRALPADDLGAIPGDADRFAAGPGTESVSAARQHVRDLAVRAGMARPEAEDFALAAHEVIANSVRHGTGHGDVAVWTDGGTLVCDVRDRGMFTEPLAGRARPPDREASGRGLWIANHLCDLVQIRSTGTGTAVRLHMKLHPA